MVSVIIPAYEAEKFIVKALDSVLGQQYRPIQLVVVNDGSKDRLESAVAEFCKQKELTISSGSLPQGKKIEKSWCRSNAGSDFSILYVEKKNGGPSSARNLGLEVADGDYVAFLDADDQWLPDKLENQIVFLEENKADVVFSDICVEKNNELYIDSVARRHGWKIPETSDEELFWFRRLLDYNFIITSTLLIRRNCLSGIEWFDESINHGEDYDFVLRLAIFNDFAFYPVPTCRKVSHEHNLSNDEVKFYQNKIYILKKIFGIYADRLRVNGVNYSDQLSKTYKNYAYYCYLKKNYMGMLGKYLRHFYYSIFSSRKLSQ